MDIIKTELDGFNIYFKKKNINFPSLMEKVAHNEIKGKPLNAENGFRSVFLVEYENKNSSSRTIAKLTIASRKKC